MLRGMVLGLGAAALAAGLVVLALGLAPSGLVFAAWGALLIIGTVYERVRYKALLPAPPGADFEKTPERFIDPETGLPVTVYADPRSGERLYIQE